MVTRRAFAGAAAALLLQAAAPACFASTRGDREVFTNASTGAGASGLLTQARFEALTGSLFMVFLKESSATLYMRLKSVEPVTPRAQTKAAMQIQAPRGGSPRQHNVQQTHGFTLYFRADGTLPEQDSYLVDHGTLGRFALFLSPGTATTGGSTVCSSFNTLSTD